MYTHTHTHTHTAPTSFTHTHTHTHHFKVIFTLILLKRRTSLWTFFGAEMKAYTNQHVKQVEEMKNARHLIFSSVKTKTTVAAVNDRNFWHFRSSVYLVKSLLNQSKLFDMHMTVAKTRVTLHSRVHIFHVFSVWWRIRVKKLGAGRTDGGVPVNKSSTGPVKVS